MTAPNFVLAQIAQDLLVQATAALDVTRTGADLPGFRYVSWADPPADLVCSVGGILAVSLRNEAALQVRNPKSTRGSPVDRNSTAILLVARPKITLLRCFPSPEAGQAMPPAATLDTAGKGLMVDAWCLMKWMTTQRSAGTLLTGGYLPRQIGLSDVVVIAPSGGMAGLTMSVEVALTADGP